MFEKIKFWSRTKKELPKEVVEEEPDSSDQVTLIINEMIYDNMLVHEKIKDWFKGNKITTCNFNDLGKDFTEIEYLLDVSATENFVQDHQHVILHCTVPEYLFKEMMKK